MSAVYADGIHTTAHQIISASPQAPTGMPPAAPQNLTVEVNGILLTLTWDTVTLDVLGNPISVDEYHVYVDGDPDFTCTDEYLYTVTADHTLVADDLVTDLDKLFFKVTAVALDD